MSNQTSTTHVLVHSNQKLTVVSIAKEMELYQS